MKNYYSKELKEVFLEFNSNILGLTSKKAEEYLKKYGQNKLEEPDKESILKKFIEQFKDFTVILLIIAAIVSGVIDTLHGDSLLNTFVILLVVLANAVIGVIQELNAEKSLDALKKLTEHTATVERDGKTIKILSKEVVPGDILLLEAGDYISADARIIESVSLMVNESQLTGESLPVQKQEGVLSEDTVLADRTNMVFTSSLVTNRKSKSSSCIYWYEY